jgi:hypothetical protein
LATVTPAVLRFSAARVVMSLEYDVLSSTRATALEPSALMKSAAAWACWMPVPLMRKTFLRLPLSRSAELRRNEHRDVGLLEDREGRQRGTGAVAPDRDVDLRGDQLGGAGRGSLRVAGLVLDGQLSLRPSTPPAALISSTAIWAPFFMYGPMAAEEPLRG